MKEWLYDWGGLNASLFRAINANHAGWLDCAMQALTWAGDHDRFEFYLAAFALFALWQHSRHPDAALTRASLIALATFSLGYIVDGFIVVGLKSAFDFPRPPAVFAPGEIVVVGKPEFHHSFPSGHASFATLVAASIWPLVRWTWMRALLVAFVVGVCLSRSYLGFHFPADVLFGSLKTLAIAVGFRAALGRCFSGTPAAR